MRLEFGRLDAAAALSGATIATCFLWFELYLLAWLAFVPLLWAAAETPTPRAAVRIGFVAGMFTNVPAFYWLTYTVTVFGGFPFPIAVFFYLCLSIYSSGQFVLLTWALHRTGSGPLALAAPLVWVTLEWLYPNLFPWRMANSQFHQPTFLQIGEWTGPFALSFAILWVAAGVADLLRPPRRWAGLALGCTMAASIFVYGAWRLPQIDRAIAEAPKSRVALVQANISIEDKGNRSYFDVNLERYAELSEPIQDDVDLLIWPETVSQHWTPADTAELSGKTMPMTDLRTPLFFGGLSYRLTGPRQADEFNSAFAVAPGGSVIGRYDKRILMPFGEYLPLDRYFPIIKKLSPATASFEAGTQARVFEIPGAMKLGPMICYEDLVAGMTRATANAGAEVLVNILNDAWYGDSAAPHQHQALALWRAVETRRYLLRGSNTGVTSIIDAAGRVVDEGGLFTEEVIIGDVARLSEPTFYTRFGDVFAALVAVGAVGLLLFGARRTGRT